MISICIPTYEMKGMGSIFLNHSLNILKQQSYKDFEIVISDHSENNHIEKLCDEYKSDLEITYIHNSYKQGNSSANINVAIKNSKYDIVKILFQDDFLFNSKSLEMTIDNFLKSEKKWLISSSIHSNDGYSFYRKFNPRFDEQLYLGNNTISSPSVLTFQKNNDTLFDENLIWLMDCDMYISLYNKYGFPSILNEVTIVNRTWEGQIQNNINNDIKIEENNYFNKKWR